VSIAIEARRFGRVDVAQKSAGGGGITYTGRCTAEQQSTLFSAVGAATTMSGEAMSYLNSTKPGPTARYTTWFGTYSSGGWSTAQSHFAAISDAFNTKPLTLDCGCKKNYYAYVYSNKPYVIYVCKVFWTAPMTGTDSKGGTLIHEMSHFNVVAGTDDWAYGQSAAKSLATSDPSKALDNADSHEYFAENTPALR
jgi:peptidyl-Lys metalloendopeptidase